MKHSTPSFVAEQQRLCAERLARGVTPAEYVAAEMHLSTAPDAVQPSLFTAPPTRESCPGDKPRLQAGGRGSHLESRSTV